MRQIKRRTKQRGFTLIEILIVVLILGILATIALPIFEGAKKKAKCAELYATIPAIETGMRLYYLEHNSYPNLALSVSQASIDQFSSVLGVDIPGTDSVFTYRTFSPGTTSVILVQLRDLPGSYLCYKCIAGDNEGKWHLYNNHPWAKYLSIPADLLV